MRVLLIEDDPMIGDAVMLALRDATYAVDWARDGEAGLALFANQQYEMVLVDLGLPKMDGYAVLTRLRQKDAQVPILVVTARDGLDDIEKGLDLGADDYVCKPFEFRELLARMRAVTRRKAGSAAPILSNGEIDLDPASREVSYHGQSLRMTSREFSLLQALLQRPGAILSRSDLEERIYNWDQEIDSNAVEFLIHSIRKKLGSDIIRNVRGLGWMVAKRQ